MKTNIKSEWQGNPNTFGRLKEGDAFLVVGWGLKPFIKTVVVPSVGGTNYNTVNPETGVVSRTPDSTEIYKIEDASLEGTYK